jgi:hypothetical protein
MKSKISTIKVREIAVNIFQHEEQEYISLTDVASFKNPKEPKDVVKNWLRNRSTIEFLGLWEQINNPDFKGVEFDSFLFDAGSNSFTLSPTKWIDATNAIGIISKQGRGGGTYAQKDIAFEFAAWISAEFKLFLIKEYQRLKADENNRLQLNWNLNRTLSKINYRIHTDAIKENIIPLQLTKDQITQIYASEADVLNVALFGLTARQWREGNPESDGNIRDYATIEQLLVLANLESLNAVFIKMGITQRERLIKLNQTAISQLKSISHNTTLKKLKE